MFLIDWLAPLQFKIPTLYTENNPNNNKLKNGPKNMSKRQKKTSKLCTLPSILEVVKKYTYVKKIK